MATKKELKQTEDQPLAGIDFSADLGGGMEGTDKDSFAIPFLRVLQKTSPQVDEASGQYIKGAEPGMLFNSVSGTLYNGETGAIFLPCAYQRRFIRWAPRGSDQSYKGEYLPEDVAAMRERGEVQDIDGKPYVANDNGEVNEKKCDRLVDTRSHFGLLLDEETGAVSQVLLPLSSTQIKKSKQLMSQLSERKVKTDNGLVTPPTWANKMRITTALESNSEGSWYGIYFSPEGFINSNDLYQLGKAFHDAVEGGQAKANYAEAETEAATEEKF